MDASTAIACAGLRWIAQPTGDQSDHASALRLLTTLEARAFIRDSGDALRRAGTFSLQLNVGVKESLIIGALYCVDALSRVRGIPLADYMRPTR